MNAQASPSESLSLERKLNMHEARDGILDRLARYFPESIDIEKFLNVVVSEIGRMLDADRCDVLQLTEGKQLEISHEWRKDGSIPSSKGTVIPIDMSKLGEKFDISEPIRINDTKSSKDPTLKFFTKALETRSLLIIPIKQGEQAIGLLGLHDTKKPRIWLDEEVAFLESIAQQLSIGYQYTNVFVSQKREARRTAALLQIANTLNSHSDFAEVSDRVIEMAVELTGADYSALGVLDTAGERISLVSFRASEGVKPSRVLRMVEDHGGSLKVDTFKAINELLQEGKTRPLKDSQLPLAIRLVFNTQLGGKSALVTPVRVGGQPFGLLGFVWSKETVFDEHDIALVEGIADQIGTALERDQLSAEVMRLKSQLNQRGSEIVGQAPSIQNAIRLAISVADTKTGVLISGESGTGKELLANLIHINSGRDDKPYIKINCGAIPETLLESELFGHEKGSFTDAHSRRIGKFEEADGGTLFLDEVGEMSMQAQVRLLRVLQDGKFTRVGGKEVISADVRIISATNVDLEQAVEDGTFRKDLYYRLSVFPIEVPPLRERTEDIQPLVYYFLERYKEKTGRHVSGISKEALRALINYDWPGNVRELENAIERSVIIGSGRNIELDDLPQAISKKAFEKYALVRQERAVAAGEGRSFGISVDLPATMEEIEKQVIEATLDYTEGDKSWAARLLNIGRRTLYRKLDQ